MNKEKALKSINSIGKAGTVISTVMQIMLIVGITALIIAGIVVMNIPGDMFEFRIESGGSIEFDANALPQSGIKLFSYNSGDPNVDINFSMNGIDYKAVNTVVNGDHVYADLEGKTNVITPSGLMIVLIAAAAILLLTMLVMIFIKKLCMSIRDCSTPFEESVIKGLERCTWVLIPWVVVAGVAKNVIESVLSGSHNLMFSISLSTVLVILLLFVLTYIFKYGAELQTESDETL